MAALDLTTTILSISPMSSAAEDAFQLDHNKSRLKPIDPPPSLEEMPKGSTSREPTPFVLPRVPKLLLSTDNKPSDLLQGYVFGSDKGTCDVLLDSNNRRGVSGRHFRIDHRWDTRTLMLHNISQHGTTMELDTASKTTKRVQLSHMIHGSVTVVAGEVTLLVTVPQRCEYQHAYDANLNRYYEQVKSAIPRVQQLGIQSSLMETPGTVRGQIHYVLTDEIGRGGFGMVFRAVDASSGTLYAAKQFSKKCDAKAVANEIQVLRDISHKSIIRFIEATAEPEPTLIMEFASLGNLSMQKNLSMFDMTIVIRDMLEALMFLHNLRITHRDIKPANILVMSRQPLVTKLSDFGVASQKNVLRTWCGTDHYIAPEVQRNKRKAKASSYTNAVDIWSLGVVGLEYTHSLPRRRKDWDETRWATEIIRQVCSCEPGLLTNLLRRMLEEDPSKRPSAQDCLSNLKSEVTTEVQTQDERDCLSDLSKVRGSGVAPEVEQTTNHRKRSCISSPCDGGSTIRRRLESELIKYCRDEVPSSRDSNAGGE